MYIEGHTQQIKCVHQSEKLDQMYHKLSSLSNRKSNHKSLSCTSIHFVCDHNCHISVLLHAYQSTVTHNCNHHCYKSFWKSQCCKMCSIITMKNILAGARLSYKCIFTYHYFNITLMLHQQYILLSYHILLLKYWVLLPQILLYVPIF